MSSGDTNSTDMSLMTYQIYGVCSPFNLLSVYARMLMQQLQAQKVSVAVLSPRWRWQPRKESILPLTASSVRHLVDHGTLRR